MSSVPQPPPGGPTLRTGVWAFVRWLASLKLAVIVLVVLAAVLAMATLLEVAHGSEYARWYIYNSRWFVALVGLLAANILAAAIVRFPWRRTQLGFVIAHAGLLVLLVGAILTLVGGVNGHLVLEEGQPGDRIVLSDYSQFVVRRMGASDRQDRFVFKPGPVDWPASETLELGAIGDVQFRLANYLAHARTDEKYVADDAGKGSAAVQFRVANAEGQPIAENWLVASPFGAQAQLSPLTIELFQLPVDTMLDDFQNPPVKDMDAKGVLAMHWEGHVQRIGVSENLGKKIPLGDKGLAVELSEYMPNAKPSSRGQFKSEGDQPKNPLVELRVWLPDQKEPLREIAFARLPFQNLGAIHGRGCPVKFWYHHPAVTATLGVQFLLAPDGKLYARTGADGKYQSRGLIHCGDDLPLAAGFRASLVEYLPHARLEVSFHVERLGAEQRGDPEAAARLGEAAARLEVTSGGETHELWLKRNDDDYGMGRVETSEGPLAVSFSYERLPLGFSLELLKFDPGMNPGGMGFASFSSSVRLVDKAGDVDQPCEISMNQPLVHGTYAFYQADFKELPNGKYASVLTVSCDPGRRLKYLGSLMLCGGTVLMFLRRTSLLRWRPATAAGRSVPDERGRADRDVALQSTNAIPGAAPPIMAAAGDRI